MFPYGRHQVILLIWFFNKSCLILEWILLWLQTISTEGGWHRNGQCWNESSFRRQCPCHQGDRSQFWRNGATNCHGNQDCQTPPGKVQTHKLDALGKTRCFSIASKQLIGIIMQLTLCLRLVDKSAKKLSTWHGWPTNRPARFDCCSTDER